MEIITETEQAELIQWANSNYTSFIKNGPGRQYQILTGLINIPPCIADIKRRIIEKEHLQQTLQEPEFKDYISYIQDGGQVTKHRVDNENNMTHVRFEVYVQMPERGGMPIINDQVDIVSERQYARRNSGIDFQASQMVQGSKARIILSFGFLEPIE